MKIADAPAELRKLADECKKNAKAPGLPECDQHDLSGRVIAYSYAADLVHRILKSNATETEENG